MTTTIHYTATEVTICDLKLNVEQAQSNPYEFVIWSMVARSLYKQLSEHPSIVHSLHDVFMDVYYDVKQAVANKSDVTENWLQTVVYNTVITNVNTMLMHTRSNPAALLCVHKGVSLDAVDEDNEPIIFEPETDECLSPAEEAHARDELARTMRAIGELPPMQKRSIECARDGLNTQETAKSLGVDESYVRKLLKAARKSLRMKVKRGEDN